jgi:predicted nucleotidyltransferase
MSGSGGGGYIYSPKSIEEIQTQLEEEKTKFREEVLGTKINDFLNGLLVSANERNTEAISKHINTIKEALDKDIDGMVDVRFAGSVAKHTYVDGLSDIDSLVILNDSELSGLTPAQVKAYFLNRLTERFPGTEIIEGRLAVTLKFNDCEIQLLPAIKSKNSIKIADYNSGNWARINPKAFTDKLTTVNQDLGGKVVPTIKLAKSIISTLPENRQLTGYHIESLAIEVFKNYQGESKYSNMLCDFFKTAADLVLLPIKDRTGQSVHTDEYMGGEQSLQRRLASDSLARVARRLANAGSLEQWKDIFKV